MNELERQLVKYKDDLKSVEQSDNKRRTICVQIAKNKGDLEELTATTNTQSVQSEIAVHCDEEQKLSDELNDIDIQITSISAMTTLLAEIRTKEMDIEKREREIRDIKERHCESFKILFPNENIETSFKRKIDILSIELHTQTNQLEAEIHLIRNEIQKKVSQLQNKNQERDNFEEELKNLEGEIDRECNQIDFAEALASTKENVDTFQMEYSALQSSDGFYKKLVKYLLRLC